MKKLRRLVLKKNTLRILRDPSRSNIATGYTSYPATEVVDLCSHSCNFCGTRWTACCESADTWC